MITYIFSYLISEPLNSNHSVLTLFILNLFSPILLSNIQIRLPTYLYYHMVKLHRLQKSYTKVLNIIHILCKLIYYQRKQIRIVLTLGKHLQNFSFLYIHFLHWFPFHYTYRIQLLYIPLGLLFLRNPLQ